MTTVLRRSGVLVFCFALACTGRALDLPESSAQPGDGGLKSDAKIDAGGDLKPTVDMATTKSGIGDPCTTSPGGGQFQQGTCPSADQVCLTPDFGFVDGYCVQQCDAQTPCPGDASCVDTGQGGQQICLLSCQGTGDCRDSYICDPDLSVCIPDGATGQETEVTPGTRDGGACVTPVVDPPTIGHFGKNLFVSPENDFAAEVQLAVDPTTKHVVVAWINIGQQNDGIGFATSLDDGATFAMTDFLPKDDGVSISPVVSDPIVTVDPKGSFYVSWVGYTQTQQNPDPTKMNIFVARSDDGGVTFPKAFRVTPTNEWSPNGGFIDKPWVAASPDGSIWATWNVSDPGSGLVNIRLARSLDQGVTWTDPVNVSEGSARPNLDRNLAMVTHDEKGNGYVAWVEVAFDALGSPDNRIYVQRFGADGTKQGGNVKVNKGMDSPTFEDASVSARNGHVYVGFISGDDTGAWDVRIAKSDDGGDTFADSVKVNDDASCATHFHHTTAIGADGRLHVLWYDNRYLVGNVLYSVSTSAPDAALTFAPSTFVTDQSFEFSTSRSSDLWLGDYLGLAVAGNSLYGAWSDPRNGFSKIAFAKGEAP